jgi:D-alanyl-D-alanine carboxypeptidase/D-alanyl-D-alanine-endopeptidase (penicillin-binding protein 4)
MGHYCTFWFGGILNDMPAAICRLGSAYGRKWAVVALLLVSTSVQAGTAQDLGSIARRLLGAGQGVYVESSDGTVLLAQAAATAVHPASVSKIPTTLALLRRLGPNHRFVTTIAATGPLRDGVIQGDLLFEGGGDPYFVDENALLVVARLRALGVLRVAGTLRVTGNVMFDWQSEATSARLRAVLAGAAPTAAWQEVRTAWPDLAGAAAGRAPALSFDDQPFDDAAAGSQALLLHRSQPLLPLVKALNDYSNNIFKPLADAAGGAAAVQEIARAAVPEAMRTEIILGDGAGTDARNRLSPRTVVRLLRALEQELLESGHSLVDILPVAGVDTGTLRERLDGAADTGRIVGKTGTFGDYGASALSGAIRTSDRGTVYFAILNHGVPVAMARRRQDAFVHALLAKLHTLRWTYVRDDRPAVARAEVILASPAPTALQSAQ